MWVNTWYYKAWGCVNLDLSQEILTITKPLHCTSFRSLFSPVSVDDGIEGEPIPPWLGEVLHVDSGVLVGRLLGPAQQRLLRRQVLLADNNVRDLQKKKNQSVMLEYLGNYDCVQIGTTLKLTDLVDHDKKKEVFLDFQIFKAEHLNFKSYFIRDVHRDTF